MKENIDSFGSNGKYHNIIFMDCFSDLKKYYSRYASNSNKSIVDHYFVISLFNF